MGHTCFKFRLYNTIVKIHISILNCNMPRISIPWPEDALNCRCMFMTFSWIAPPDGLHILPLSISKKDIIIFLHSKHYPNSNTVFFLDFSSISSDKLNYYFLVFLLSNFSQTPLPKFFIKTIWKTLVFLSNSRLLEFNNFNHGVNFWICKSNHIIHILYLL